MKNFIEKRDQVVNKLYDDEMYGVNGENFLTALEKYFKAKNQDDKDYYKDLSQEILCMALSEFNRGE